MALEFDASDDVELLMHLIDDGSGDEDDDDDGDNKTIDFLYYYDYCSVANLKHYQHSMPYYDC